jgi:hypothetical protein
MKQNFLKLTGVLFLILFSVYGCTKKEDPIQDPVLSTGKQIISFKVLTTTAITGTIDTVNKTINVSVPAGTSLTSLSTEITLGASYTISPASGVAQNFTNPVVYTVTRGTSSVAWTVNVTAPLSSGKQITSFKIVTPSATGVIDTTAKTIAISVPVGTVLTSLTTDIALPAGYTISPASGVARDFTNPVTYTITRVGSTSGTNWTVTVKILYPVLSAGKQLIYFKFVTPAVTGTIDTVAKTITLPVSAGTNVTSLVTDISIAPGYTISPASGVAKDFTNPVSYTISRTGQTSVVWTVSASSPIVNVTADITASVTWTANKTYIITGDIEVSGNAVLTIEAGTVVKFNAGAQLSIGYYSTGTLIANGTANSPITLTSNALSPAAGAWKGLFFYDYTSSNTSLAFCNIQYAGSNSSYGAINMTSCDIAINNSTISNSNSYGIKTSYSNSKGGFVSFSNNTISSTANYGIVMNAQKISSIGTGNTFTNAVGVLIEGNFNSNTAQTWRKLSVPYIIDQEVLIDGNLTIEAGTTFKFTVNGWMAIGYYASTTFIADGGSNATPITFTSTATSPAAGAWRSIAFYSFAQTNSKMNYCIIDYAGSNSTYGALDMNSTSSIIFTNNIIRNSASFGINMDNDSGFQTFTNNTVNTCTNHVIVINTKHLPDLGAGNTLTPAAGKGILVSGSISYGSPVTWKKQTADFYMTGGGIGVDGDVTIEAGINFLFVNDSYFYFGYYASTKITAVGTSTNPITFTSAASSPAAGAWRGVRFYDLTQTNSALTYCTFHYTGMLSHPAIYCDISFPINNTTIDNFSSTHAAEYKTGNSVPAGSGNSFSWFAN